jgi:hypothetical protein
MVPFKHLPNFKFHLFFSMSALHESSSTNANGSNIDCASHAYVKCRSVTQNKNVWYVAKKCTNVSMLCRSLLKENQKLVTKMALNPNAIDENLTKVNVKCINQIKENEM